MTLNLFNTVCSFNFKMLIIIIRITIISEDKSWLIVKNSELAESARKVFDDEVNITLEGRRHLGAVIGSKEFKNQYCQEKVDKWLREMEPLTEISKS